MRVRRLTTPVVQVLLLAVVAGASPWPAAGDNWGSVSADCDTSRESQCVMPNGVVDVYFGHLDGSRASLLKSATLDRMDRVYDPLDGSSIQAYELGGEASADARVRDVSVDIGAWAWTACSYTAQTGGTGLYKWCAPQNLYYNDGQHSEHFDSSNERSRNACHEMGHIFGLRHANGTGDSDVYRDSCMYEGNWTANFAITDHDERKLMDLYPLP